LVLGDQPPESGSELDPIGADHYACHGSQDLGDPFRGALHLHDGPLSIAQITSLQLPNPVLAYVSACDTGRGGTSIPDEGITLASALQIAGYQHVVATLWQIIGFTATGVAKRLYDQVVTVHDGVPPAGHGCIAGQAGLTAWMRSTVPALSRSASTTWNPAAWTRGSWRRVKCSPAARTVTCSRSHWAA
jgi:CHAT domain